MAFYTKHNPDKLREVDELLKKYEFNEELLFQRLHRKYNALAAGPENHSVMKKIDEGEFLYEEEEEDRVESSEEEAAQMKQVASTYVQDEETNEEEDQARPFTHQQSSGSTGSEESFEAEETKEVAVAVMHPPEIEDYDLLEGTPPVSPRSAEKLACTHRQSSTLIKDAIALARQAQRERIERRIASIASKCGDGYAGH